MWLDFSKFHNFPSQKYNKLDKRTFFLFCFVGIWLHIFKKGKKLLFRLHFIIVLIYNVYNGNILMQSDLILSRSAIIWVTVNFEKLLFAVLGSLWDKAV